MQIESHYLDGISFNLALVQNLKSLSTLRTLFIVKTVN